MPFSLIAWCACLTMLLVVGSLVCGCGVILMAENWCRSSAADAASSANAFAIALGLSLLAVAFGMMIAGEPDLAMR